MAVLMDEYVPFDAGPGANAQEDQWRAMMRYQVQNGVLRNVDNELAVYGDSTGMQVKVKTGQVLITGHWGAINAEDILPVTAAHATLPRRDLVVARVDYGANEIELDVVAGTAGATPVVPSLTRNTDTWEIPLAVVQVDAAVSTIAAAKVLDTRQWGGPLTSATSDDMLAFGDRLSPCPRALCNGEIGTGNGNLYMIKMQSTLDQVVSTIKFYVTTARVGGTGELKIFYNGWRDDMFFSSVTPTFSNFGMNAAQITTGTFSPISLRAGEMVAVVMRFASTTTAPQFAGLNVSAGIGANANNLLNAGATTGLTCAFKNAASMPSTPLNLIDGTWGTRDRYFWCALS